MKKVFISLLVVLLSDFVFAHNPEHFHKLMEPIHASGTGAPGTIGSSITGAYAIKTNGYEYGADETYDPNVGCYEFWSMNFGQNQSLRKFTLGVDGSDWYNHFDGFSWTSFYDGYGDYADTNVNNAGLDNLVGTSVLYATESDLGRVASGNPNFAGGICSTSIGGSLRAGSFVLNPAALTFNGVAYQQGELALITSIDGSSLQQYRKVVLLYDLRQIGEYTNSQPDYNTGQDGLGNQTPIYGSYNQTDWNDSFYPLVTGQMILDTIPEGTSAITFNYGRQAVWAPDAIAIYFAGFTVNAAYNENDSNDFKYYNGIWKYDFSDNQLKWIKRHYTRGDDRMFYCEMAALHTNTRDFTDGAEEGVQILFSSEVENVGGICCIVDNDQIDPSVYTVLDANEYSAMCGKHRKFIDIRNIFCDPQGNIYFYDIGKSTYVSQAKDFLYIGSYAICKYDSSGRLYAVSNRGHHMNFNYANGVSISSSTGAMGAFQYYPNLFGSEMLTFRSTPLKVPCGLKLFEPLDFNHDSKVDIGDLIIFRDQRINNDRWLDPIFSDAPLYVNDPNVMPGIFAVDANYINCDINGNSMYRCVLIDEATGNPVPENILWDLDNLLDPNGKYTIKTDKRYFTEKVVTEADAEVLYQFIPAGDANLDGKVNFSDYAFFAANYNTGNSTDNKKDFSQGDFNFDGHVDLEDLESVIELLVKR